MDEKRVLEKIDFYRVNEIKCHVKLINNKFRNGLFVSRLEPGNYFWFIDNKTSIPVRLFLNEIYDIQDYIPEEEWKEIK